MNQISVFLILITLLFTSVSGEEDYLRAMEYYNSRRLSQAEDIFLKLTKDKNRNSYKIPSLIKLATIYSDREDYYEYIISNLKIIKIGHHDDYAQRACFKLAVFFREHNFSREAVKCYRRIRDCKYKYGYDEAVIYLNSLKIKKDDKIRYNNEFFTEKELKKLKLCFEKNILLKNDHLAYDLKLYEEILDIAEYNEKLATKKIQRFIDLYPNSLYRNKVYLILADIKINEKNYATARNLLIVTAEKIKNRKLLNEIHERLGFIAFKMDQLKISRDHFIKTDNILATALISVKLRDYKTARLYFKRYINKRKIKTIKNISQLKNRFNSYLPLIRNTAVFSIKTVDNIENSMLDNAIYFMNKKEYNKSERQFVELLSRNKKHMGALLGLCINSIFRGKYREANTFIQILSEKFNRSEKLNELTLFIAQKLDNDEYISRSMMKIITSSGSINNKNLDFLIKSGILDR